MTEQERGETRRAALEKQHRLLAEKIERLEEEKNLTTDPEKRFELEKKLEKLGAQLREIESELNQGEKNSLIQDARRIERNKAYQEAIQIWEQIRQLDPQDESIDSEIERLQNKLAQSGQIRERITALTRRLGEIKDIHGQVIQRLRQFDESSMEDEAILVIVDEFIQKKMSAADFIGAWQSLTAEPIAARLPEETNYPALADRLKRGDIALSLGSDIPYLFDDRVLPPADLIKELAKKAKYADFVGSLSEIAEYYEMSDYSRSSLISYLRSMISDAANVPVISLYEKLATIQQPLILISAGYDAWLELAFSRQDKKYLLISPFIRGTHTFDVGYLHLQYSDKDKPEAPCLQEDLSGLKPLEQGYSLIYKIRGCCVGGEHQHPHQQHTLTLSERDYFTFARHMDKLIPDYLAAALADRGLFFLGYEPRHWEDRLIANAILNKRRQQSDPPYTVVKDVNHFQHAYWESNSIRRRAVDLTEFVDHLAEYM